MTFFNLSIYLLTPDKDNFLSKVFAFHSLFLVFRRIGECISLDLFYFVSLTSCSSLIPSTVSVRQDWIGANGFATSDTKINSFCASKAGLNGFCTSVTEVLSHQFLYVKTWNHQLLSLKPEVSSLFSSRSGVSGFCTSRTEVSSFGWSWTNVQLLK